MGDLGEQLQELIREKYHGIPGIAKQTSIPQQTIYSMCRSGVTGSSLNTVIPIAEALDIDPYALSQGQIAPADKNYIEAPVFDFGALDAQAAARPIAGMNPLDIDAPAIGAYPISVALRTHYPSAFFTHVPDASLNRILPDGCLAFIDPCTAIEHPGKPYAVAIKGRGLVAKRARPLANGLELKPDSTDPTYETQVLNFRETDADDVAIVGEIVWYAIPFDWDFEVG